MSVVSPEAIDRIIAELCQGTSKDNLVPYDLDKMALARALEEVRERYEEAPLLRPSFDEGSEEKQHRETERVSKTVQGSYIRVSERRDSRN